jgi:NAD(P)-dependent dehydrogenase (short-subunit alcohol dehydrogenase family)
MSTRLLGRRAIVTGAGRGIGRAVAMAFAREGADVCLVARDEQRLAEAEVEITSAGGKAWTWPCDVRDEHQVDGLVAAAVERSGGIDVLVNNAAIDDDTPFLEIELARWRAVIDTNLNAPFLLAQRVARHMAAAGGGVLLHTASVDASGADGPYAAYNSSKAGLLGLNRTIAVELARYGIRSNVVSPGFTRTEMTEKSVGPGRMAYLETSFARVPMRRLIHVDEVADGFVFLASDESSAITGTELRVDGGLTANLYVLETLPDVER